LQKIEALPNFIDKQTKMASKEQQIKKIEKHVLHCISHAMPQSNEEKYYQFETRIIPLVYHFGVLLIQLYLI